MLQNKRWTDELALDKPEQVAVKEKMQRHDCKKSADKQVPETAPAGVPGAIRDDGLRERLIVVDAVGSLVVHGHRRRHERCLFQCDLTSWCGIHGGGW